MKEMEPIFFTVTLVQVIIGGIMTSLLVREYLKNRYLPTALLGLFFGLFTLAFSLTVPIFWIPNEISGRMIAIFLQDASVICLFLMFPFLIMAFEGMKGRILSPITTLFIALTAVAISYLTLTQPWEYTWSGLEMWFQETYDEFLIVFVGFVLIAVFIVLGRLIEFTIQEGPVREKRMTIIALTGFLGTIIGGITIFVLGIPNVDYLFVAIGTTIIAAIYLKYPHSFFLSHTRIHAIMLINTQNKIPYLVIDESKDEKSSKYVLAAAGLGGIMMLLQEILDSERPPTRLFHKDKGILLEHDIKNEISGVIVADQINDVLRSPLKYTISLFVKKFKAEIADWVGEISRFAVFEKDLRKIFKFALPESIR